MKKVRWIEYILLFDEKGRIVVVVAAVHLIVIVAMR